MPGPDPMDAARAVDAQDDASTSTTTQHPSPLRNIPKFDDFSQGLAGTLIAEKNKLDRIREDLTDQMLGAQRARDAEIEAAKAAFDERVKAASDAFTEANAMLEAKANDAVKAQDGIARALAALT